MKTLYIECNMGVAGDMLMGALLDTLEDKDTFIQTINNLGIPDTKVSYRVDEKCGIIGTHVSVNIAGKEEYSEDVHEHHHGHGHHQIHEHNYEHTHSHSHHSHTSLKTISEIVDGMNASSQIKEDVKSVYRIIAEAESNAHGKTVEQIHFHEVGTMDALLDITGCCILIRQIKADRIVVSPIKTGYGHVHCAHGILPIPAPATATILKGIPNSAGNIEGELCTPTGAALIKYFANEYAYQPVMTVEQIGYGTGNKDFQVANCVRVLIGEGSKVAIKDADEPRDEIIELACNIDDMTGEEIGYAVEKLMEGMAVDVYTTTISMKKSRPGIKLAVLCKPSDKEDIIEEIFKYTKTIGIREYLCQRYVLDRNIERRQTPLGEVRVKVSEGYGQKKEKMEYEDLKEIAEKIK